MKTKTIRIAAVALLVLAAAAFAGVGRPDSAGGASEHGDGITVNGVGTVSSVPDEAQMSFGVQTEGATSREALARNSARMERVLAALEAAGITKKDLRTQDVSVWPKYDMEGEQAAGYTARNSVSVTIDELDKAGAVIDAATRAGANEVSGPMLSSSARDELDAKALEAAVANARKKAEALAKAAGVGLGHVTAMVEGGATPGPVVFDAMRATAESGKAVPIRPGQEEIQATVTVTFSIE
ncbi:MAG TPA: SIMPL domain-containing protein [Gaiellaceae bacterium]|nr:SIMPL domain-containing protein [Gaiellaceae bacterium]